MLAASISLDSAPARVPTTAGSSRWSRPRSEAALTEEGGSPGSHGASSSTSLSAPPCSSCAVAALTASCSVAPPPRVACSA
eukprot:1039475-Prymnesium_polylepis.1